MKEKMNPTIKKNWCGIVSATLFGDNQAHNVAPTTRIANGINWVNAPTKLIFGWSITFLILILKLFI